jgi:hypothetical protein
MIDLPALRSLLAAATPRPWRVEDRRPPRIDGLDRNVAAYSEGDYGWKVSDLTAADADLIVAAINALPQLLSVYEAALAWREVVRDERYDPLDAGTDLIAAIDLARSGK